MTIAVVSYGLQMLWIFVTLFVSCGTSHAPLTFTEFVAENASITINCSTLEKPTSNHVWWFNNNIIFARGIRPTEIGFHNIRGSIVNSTLSYLQFHGFSVTNSGNYSCTNGGIVSVSYVLNILEKTDSPVVVRKSVKVNTSITINCSSSTNSSEKHVWWFNGDIILAKAFRPNEIGVHNVKGEYVDSISLLHIEGFAQNNTGNYTCNDGHAVKTYMLDIKALEYNLENQENDGESQVNAVLEFISSTPVVASISGSVVVLAFLCCICAVTKRLKNGEHNASRSSRAHINASEGKSVVIDDGSSSEYEKTGIIFFSPSNITIHNLVLSSPRVLRFVGSLRNCDKTETNVLVSSTTDPNDVSLTRMWSNYVDAALRLVGHRNLLEMMGLCWDNGEMFVIQCYYETTLKQHLLSLSRRSDETTHLAQRSYSQFASDVINGMQFLSSSGCFHPGLSTEKVLVTTNYVCKLYDFCAHEDVETFTEMNFPESERLLMTGLAPEYVLSGEYTSASDVWCLGITVWEIYCGDENALDELDVGFIDKFRSGMVKLPRPKNCSKMFFESLELCWSVNSKDRPKISDLLLKLRESVQMLEESQSISLEEKDDVTIGADSSYDGITLPCSHRVYHVLESPAE